jgi:hypothetical protein
MDWAEWASFLEELCGLGSGGEKVYLLIPKTKSELTKEQGKVLADVVNKRLFSSYRSARYQLEKLLTEPARESLPLLYLSAWIARQQEDAHAFWPPFQALVVRNKLSIQTVQQSLAPLISTLWTKAHRELGIYRPQEGYAHVKWPQAHAGLTQEEIQLLARMVASNTGVSDEPPDDLYGEPNEFLQSMRIWLQSESHVSRRLSRLVFGQDGPASVVAELTQKLLLQLWPPKDISTVAASRKRTPPPYVRLDIHPIRLSIVVPAGSVPGYAMLQAHYAANEVELETSYSERSSVTSYKSYECPVAGIPWSSEVTLAGHELPVRMRVVPECPFARGRLGLIMFDPTTGRCVRRWRPNHHYWLLTGVAGAPTWIGKLFTDIETEDAGAVAGLDVTVFSAVGRDIVGEFGRDGSLQVLQEMEEDLNKSTALITLPDYNELLQPELTLSGGLPIAHGRYPVYLHGHSPFLVLRNTSESDISLFLYSRDDTGHESLVASVSLDEVNHSQPVILEPPELTSGFYVIRSESLREPSYFSLTTELPQIPDFRMDVSISLLRADQVANIDDMRHFETRGIELRSWPYARVMFKVSTEAGSYAHFIRMDSDGRRVVRAHDVDLPQTAKWAKIQANAWLAVSKSIEIVLRPYVAPGDWVLEGRRLTAKVRGVDKDTGCVLVVIPDKPWEAPIRETYGKVEVDSQVDVEMPVVPKSGWIVLTDNAYSGAWLFSCIREPQTEYDIEDFQAVHGSTFILPCYLAMVKLADDRVHQMFCLARLAILARHARTPSEDDPLPGNLTGFIGSLQSAAFRTVELASPWRLKQATLEWDDSLSGYGFLTVDDGRFRVYVDPGGPEIKLKWLEDSSPCICGGCGRIMTKRQWDWHRHGNAVTLLPRDFLAKPLVNWPSVMDLVERAILDAIAKQSSSPPRGLDSIWASLQRSFRKRTISRPISPEEWVESVFASWRILFHLVNGEKSDHDWVSVWKSIEEYEDALKNLAI